MPTSFAGPSISSAGADLVPLSHDRYWKNVHSDAIDFIKSLLKLNPDERPTASQVSLGVVLSSARR